MAVSSVTALAMIPVVGVAAAWVAWRLHLPSILALLAAGLVVGPLLGWLEPDELLGELLEPLVGIAVALILFEGGLSLTGRELRRGGRVVLALLSVGVAITFGVGALLAFGVLGLPGDVAIVLAAVVVVTGPTVVGPVLSSIRPVGDVGPVLKAEGILVDPIGAVLATLAYQVTFGAQAGPALLDASRGMLVFAVTGAVVGGGLGLLAREVLHRYLVPDSLVTAFGLALAVGAYALANGLYEQSGLLAATVLGIVIGTTQRADVHQVLEFQESVRTLLIAGLFVVLGARLTTEELESITWTTFAFVLGLIVVARPLAVAVCTLRSSLTWRERVLAAWMAPRGIVAAAVASVFALRLQGSGESGAEQLVPTVFLTILVTIAVYGLTAPWLARRLGLSDRTASGVLIVGAGPLAVAIGVALRSAGVRVLLADSDHDGVAAARRAGLETYEGTVVSDEAAAELDLRGIGTLLACTANREAAALAALHYSRDFGREHVYQVPVAGTGDRPVSKALRCRSLATQGLGIVEMTDALRRGAEVVAVRAGPDRRLPAAENGRIVVPLVVVRPGRLLQVAAADGVPARQPGPGDVVVAFVDPAPGSPRRT